MVQRLSTTGHWIVPFEVPGRGRVHLMTFHASPPVFDGPEDRNGKRNHDEIMFWIHFMNGAFGEAPKEKFIVLGDANNDPSGGQGSKQAIRTLLDDPRLQDPLPQSAGSLALSGKPSDTVDWPEPEPGNLRVDYVLPSKDWHVSASGVYWPDDAAAQKVEQASRHRLVWVDLDYPANAPAAE